MTLKIWLHVFTLALALHTAVPQALTPPSFREVIGSANIYYSPNEGEHLRLPCVADGVPKPNYQWQFNEQPLSGYQPSQDGTIDFLDPGISKQGYYQCIVSNSVGKAYSNITLVQLAQQAAFAEPVTAAKSVTVGESITLYCQPTKTTVPPPRTTNNNKEIEWRYDSDGTVYPQALGKRALIDNMGNLLIGYATLAENRPDDVLKCYITNRISSVSVGGSPVRISVKPGTGTRTRPVIMYYTNKTMNPGDTESTIIALEGRNTSLQCFFSGSDSVGITWEKTGDPLPTDGRVVQLNFNIELVIRNVKKSDEGRYSCQGMEPSVGQSAPFSFNVIVQAAPVFKDVNSKPHDVNGTVGEDLTIQCNAYAIPDAKVSWYLNGNILDPTLDANKKRFSWSSDGKMLTVLRLCKDSCKTTDNGPMVIQCNSSNVHGYTFANGYINVFLKTVLDNKPPGQLYPSAHEKINLTVSATSDPNTPITYSWYFKQGDKPEMLIVNTEDYTLSNDSTTLVIHSVDEVTVGEYKIIASNGISQDTYVIVVNEPPGIYKSSVWEFWWIPFIIILIVVIVIIIVCCVFCCLRRNRGDEYPVDEKERENDRNPEKELEENGFHDYQRPTHRPTQDIERQPLTYEKR